MLKDHILFVDTETSGIPESLQEPVSKTGNWPFILQLAWRIYDKAGNLIKAENHFIYEKEISIEKSSTRIHGITLQGLKEQGEDRKDVIRLFVNDLRKFRPLIVGHFLEFDSKMLQVAMHRSGLKNHMKSYPHFCTMRAATDYAFPNKDYPGLDELYQRLFKERLTEQHDAAVDAEAGARVFFELYRRGELTEQLNEPEQWLSKVKRKARTGCGLPVIILALFGLLSLIL